MEEHLHRLVEVLSNELEKSRRLMFGERGKLRLGWILVWNLGGMVDYLFGQAVARAVHWGDELHSER